MNYTDFQINEFRLKDMVKHPTILALAKRGSGKSWIIRDIMYETPEIPGGIIIAATDRLNSFYRDFFPDIYIHYEVTPIIFKKVLIRQKKMKEKADRKAEQGLKVNPAAFFVMDDCLAQKNTWLKDPNVLEILMNGRHYELTFILTTQYSMSIPPELRTNFDYIFILNEDFTSNKRRLYDHYVNMFPHYKIFEHVFDEVVKDYGSMVIDNRKPSKDISKKVFWFKANDRKSAFKFGSTQFREFHKQYYDPEYENRLFNDGFDINNILPSKKFAPFKVVKVS
jgi:hypothetical protein